MEVLSSARNYGKVQEIKNSPELSYVSCMFNSGYTNIQMEEITVVDSKSQAFDVVKKFLIKRIPTYRPVLIEVSLNSKNQNSITNVSFNIKCNSFLGEEF